MSKNLFSIVSENLQGALDSGKTPVGYTVKNYLGVLAALLKAKVVYNLVQRTRVSTTIGSRRYTLLSLTGLEGADDGTGFIVHLNSNELSYQALCVVKEYMSFVVDYTVPNEENKKARSWVGVKDRPSKDSHALKGMSILSSGISFPPVEEEGNNTITRMSLTLGGDNEPCRIGVGLSLNNLAYNFMKRFFPLLELTEEHIESLASKGYLNAEVLIPKGKGESAFVLHARVTVRHEINDESAPFLVWIPVPIMLLNSFKKLGTVTVEAGTGQQEKVGESNVTFPFANSTYNHEEAEISNFTPSSLKAFALSLDTPVQYVRSNLCNEGIATQARVRLYFIESSKADILKTIGKPIPEAYAKELFKGKVNVIKVESISPVGAIALGASEMEFYQFVSNNLHDKLDAMMVKRAIDGVSLFETGQDWTKAADINDGQGVSCGGLQFTENAGGVKKFCQVYKREVAANKKEISDTIQHEMLHGISTGKVSNISVFREMLSGDFGKMCQLKLWWEEKGKYSVEAYREAAGGKQGCALLLSVVMGSVNHLPSMYSGHLAESGAPSVNDMKQKIKLAEAAHWSMWMEFAAKSSDYSYTGYSDNGSWVKYAKAQTILDTRGEIIKKVGKYTASAINRFRANIAAAENGDYNMERIPKRGDKPVGW